MFAKARLLILATFALLSTLTGASVPAAIIPRAPIPQQSRPLPTQTPDTVSVQTSSRAGNPIVVTVDKSRVHVNELVRFTLSPASLVTNPNLNVTIDFGDGTKRETRQTSVTHRYRATGHYKVYASVVSPGFEIGSQDPKRPKAVPSVTLTAKPSTVVARNPVNFGAQLTSNYPGIKYRFVFGDGSQTDWQESAYTSYSYDTGGTYLAYVDLGLGNGGGTRQVGGSVRQPILVSDLIRPKPTPEPSPQPTPIEPQPGPVELTANPTQVELGNPVTFNASVAAAGPRVRYRFVFGDGSTAGLWQTGSQASHTYASVGDYAAHVEIGRLTAGRITPLGKSSTKTISVISSAVAAASPTPTPTGGTSSSPSPTNSIGGTTGGTIVSPSPSSINLPEDWWLYLLIALLLIFAAYQVYRALSMPPATIHPNRDMGNSEVDATSAAKGLSITSQVLLRPNLSGGEYQVHTDEGDIVRSVRRENV